MVCAFGWMGYVSGSSTKPYTCRRSTCISMPVEPSLPCVATSLPSASTLHPAVSFSTSLA